MNTIASRGSFTPMLGSLGGAKGALGARGAGGAAAPAGFAGALGEALRSVDTSQQKAQNLQRQVELENPAVSLEETMVATQQANIQFQAALHVRNRLVQAYTDIMNMQV